MGEAFALTGKQFDDYLEMRRRVLGQVVREESPEYSRGNFRSRSLVVMLLESIESGQSGRAAVLSSDKSRNRFWVTVYGALLSGSEVFRLRWGLPGEANEEVDSISVFSTPLELQNKLEQFSFVSPGDISVSFGNHARMIHDLPVEFNVFRWLITVKNGRGGDGLIIPGAQGSNAMWVGTERTFLRDTGSTIRIESPLPIGNTRSGKTPQQPGAIAVVDWVDGTGWTINAIESRWIDPDAEDEIEYY